MKTPLAILGIFSSLGLFILAQAALAQVAPSAFRWSTATYEHSQRKMALVLEVGSRVLELRNGWSCTVGELQQRAEAESRTTTCEKGSEVLSFITHCTSSDPQESTRIWFGDPNLGSHDLIEVNCGPNDGS
jgi:hypothetical protein